ncbi:MAG: hypothetical protein M3N51_04230 [Actinomycetota bacterium]|nr:hypothetical protein [Actinomycetota bacterium]
MIGPVALLIVALVVGAGLGGTGGALGGLLAAVGLIGSVALGALTWAQRVGRFLEPAEARRLAPCPPGFSRLCQAVYGRTLPSA